MNLPSQSQLSGRSRTQFKLGMRLFALLIVFSSLVVTIPLARAAHQSASQTAEMTANSCAENPGNILKNGSFELGKNNWIFYTNGTGNFDIAGNASDCAQAAKLTLANVGTNTQLNQRGFRLNANTRYRLSFSAYSSSGNDLRVYVHRQTSPYTNYGSNAAQFSLTNQWQDFSIEFTARNFTGSTTDTRLRFWFPGLAANGDTYFIDNVVLEEAGASYPTSTSAGPTSTATTAASATATSAVTATATAPPPSATPTSGSGGCSSISSLLNNPSFESGTTNWTFYTNGAGSFTSVSPAFDCSKAANLTLTRLGKNVQLNQSGFPLQANTRYRISFAAYSNTGHDMALFIHRQTSPYTNYGLGNQVVQLTTSWQEFSYEFTTTGFSGTTTNSRLRFWFPGRAANGDVYRIDKVVLEKVSASEPNTPTDTPVPTATNTSAPATASSTTAPSTPTSTPAPPTATNTPAPPTATNTPAPPTATNTPAPPTATPTSTGSGGGSYYDPVGIWDNNRNGSLWTHGKTPEQLAAQIQQRKSTDRGRVYVQRKTVLTDNGRLLRGETLRASFLVEREFTITHMERAMDLDVWKEYVTDYNLNTVRFMLYREPAVYLAPNAWNCPVARCFSTVQEALPYIDAAVEIASEMGMYIVIDYHPVGGYDTSDATQWWSVLAPRYKNRTHVLYELANEPVTWSASDYTQADIVWQGQMYHYLRSMAPQTHIILWSIAQITDCCMLPTVSQASTINYSNASVGYHPYAMIHDSWNPADLNQLRNAGYPVFATELGVLGGTAASQYQKVTQLQEGQDASWLWLDGSGQGRPWQRTGSVSITWDRDPATWQPSSAPPTPTPGSPPAPTATPPPASNCEPETSNVLNNPSFEDGLWGWYSYFANGVGSLTTSSPAFKCNLAARIAFSGSSNNMQVYQTGFSLQRNTDYLLSFSGYSNSSHDLSVFLTKHTPPHTNYGIRGVTVNLESSWKTFTIPFTTGSDVSTPRLRFWFVDNASAGDVYWIDDVRIAPASAGPPP